MNNKREKDYDGIRKDIERNGRKRRSHLASKRGKSRRNSSRRALDVGHMWNGLVEIDRGTRNLSLS
ncbi:MAG: hypothetical protein QME40_01105 [bacterium]|nr:hypothetical protein [bacterium]